MRSPSVVNVLPPSSPPPLEIMPCLKHQHVALGRVLLGVDQWSLLVNMVTLVFKTIMTNYSKLAKAEEELLLKCPCPFQPALALMKISGTMGIPGIPILIL